MQADRGGRIDAAYTIFAVVCIEVWCRIFLDSYSGREAEGGVLSGESKVVQTDLTDCHPQIGLLIGFLNRFSNLCNNFHEDQAL